MSSCHRPLPLLHTSPLPLLQPFTLARRTTLDAPPCPCYPCYTLSLATRPCTLPPFIRLAYEIQKAFDDEACFYYTPSHIEMSDDVTKMGSAFEMGFCALLTWLQLYVAWLTSEKVRLLRDELQVRDPSRTMRAMKSPEPLRRLTSRISPYLPTASHANVIRVIVLFTSMLAWLLFLAMRDAQAQADLRSAVAMVYSTIAYHFHYSSLSESGGHLAHLYALFNIPVFATLVGLYSIRQDLVLRQSLPLPRQPWKVSDLQLAP